MVSTLPEWAACSRSFAPPVFPHTCCSTSTRPAAAALPRAISSSTRKPRAARHKQLGNAAAGGSCPRWPLAGRDVTRVRQGAARLANQPLHQAQVRVLQGSGKDTGVSLAPPQPLLLPRLLPLLLLLLSLLLLLLVLLPLLLLVLLRLLLPLLL